MHLCIPRLVKNVGGGCFILFFLEARALPFPLSGDGLSTVVGYPPSVDEAPVRFFSGPPPPPEVGGVSLSIGLEGNPQF